MNLENLSEGKIDLIANPEEIRHQWQKEVLDFFHSLRGKAPEFRLRAYYQYYHSRNCFEIADRYKRNNEYDSAKKFALLAIEYDFSPLMALTISGLPRIFFKTCFSVNVPLIFLRNGFEFRRSFFSLGEEIDEYIQETQARKKLIVARDYDRGTLQVNFWTCPSGIEGF